MAGRCAAGRVTAAPDLSTLAASAAALSPKRPFPTTFVGFCAWLGVTLTPGQRVLCSVAYDGVEPKDLSEEDKAIALKIFGPVETVPEAARATLAVVAGARAGKSYTIGLHMVWAALTVSLKSMAPGQKAVSLVVAANAKLRNEVIAYALGACRSKPELAAMLVLAKGKNVDDSGDSFRIRRKDGHLVWIEAAIAGRGGYGARGRSLVGAYLDEAAFFRDSGYQVCDVEIYKAASPRVLPGGITVVCSTPWAESGLLYDFHKKNFGKPTECLVAHAPTLLLNDSEFVQKMVARERLRDPDNASREFDAIFVTGGTSLFFPASEVDGAVDDSIDCEAR